MKMKLKLEKDEVLMLGQLALELQDKIPTGMSIQAVLFWEFYLENASLFVSPESMKRKIRFSTFLGLFGYLASQPMRNDIWWDMTLQGLIDKLNRMRSDSSIRTKLLLQPT